MFFKSSGKIFPAILIFGIFCFLFYGCTKIAYSLPEIQGYPKPYKVMGRWYQPIPDAEGFEQIGIASWYGEKFHGRKTANGEIFDMYEDSAAHKILPLNTWVKVINLNNNKRLDVRINDRGPFVKNRVIDLSYSAAKKLGFAESGTARVKIIVLGTRINKPNKHLKSKRLKISIPQNYYKQTYTIQVGAFSDIKNAEKLIKKLAGFYDNAHIVSFYKKDKLWHRVRVCKSWTLKQAKKDEKRMIKAGFKDAIIIAE